jgi:Caspase domain
MARIGGSPWFAICAVAVSFFWAASAAQAGEQIPGLVGIFSGLINTAIVDAARRDWQTRPLSDYNCLGKHGLSAAQFADRGIGPEDPQVRQILSDCAFAAPAAPVPAAPQPANGPVAEPPGPSYAAPASPNYAAPQTPNDAAPPPSPNYFVNGLTLGAPLGPPADAMAGYTCHASEDYPGFSWCQSHHAESRRFGATMIWMSIFRSPADALVEITQAVDPAFFRPGDAEREIQRLSHDFGQQARIIPADLPAGGHSIIAAWGAVTLTPLDSTNMDALRGGTPVHSGLLLAALGDPRATARLGLQVYGLGGGAGFIWSANYNSSGKGVLRITAVDPSALSPHSPSQPAAPTTPFGMALQFAPEAPSTPPALGLDVAAQRGPTVQGEKVVVAAMQPAVTADALLANPAGPPAPSSASTSPAPNSGPAAPSASSAPAAPEPSGASAVPVPGGAPAAPMPSNAPAASASSSASAIQTAEAKVEQPPAAPLASPAFPLSRIGRRVALIVANGAYSAAPLTNPTVDADLVSGSLEKIGFSVTVKKDLDLDGFEQAISEFAETTRGAEIALFYFAGHGFYVADGGRQQNLLMATSANFSAKTALALEGGGEPLDHVEETIIGRARATLIFIDACRNVPALASRGFGSRGFAPLNASNLEGAYVVLSTRVGQTAEDGAGGQGSPFARAFASVLPTPGLRIEDAYYRMREQVRKETSGVQVPDSIRSDLPEGGVVLVEGNLK